MKLLYVVGRETYEMKMSRVRFQQVAAMAEQVPVHVSGPGWPDWDESKSAGENAGRVHVLGSPGDAVLAYDVEGLAGCPLPVITSFNEAFSAAKVEGYVRRNGVRMVVFHHQNDLTRYPHWADLGILRAHVHHCADESVYKDYGEAKDIDVLVAGNLNEHYYPFRVRLRDLAWRVLRKRGYRVVVLKHPGYRLPPREGTVIGEDFARLLNRSHLVVTCAMRFKYALAKYSEIGLCRSLALADVPDERPEHFAQTVRVVSPHMLDEDILRSAEEVLDDEELRKTLTDRAWDLTRKTSTMAHYAERFLKVAAEAAEAGPVPVVRA